MTISTEKLYNPTYDDITDACIGIAKQILLYDIKFDAIVGVSRGGLIPATILSQLLGIPLIPVSYSAKEGNGDNRDHDNILPVIDNKTILIMDDICDSGYTLKELSEHYTHSSSLTMTFTNTVYTGCIYYKMREQPVIATNFSWVTIQEDAPWVIYPWETTRLVQ